MQPANLSTAYQAEGIRLVLSSPSFRSVRSVSAAWMFELSCQFRRTQEAETAHAIIGIGRPGGA